MFNEILKDLRVRTGLSQIQFAKETGFSQAAISAWENNTREPGIYPLKKIAQYFNVSIDYLVGNPSPSTKKQNNTIGLLPNEKKLLDNYRNLSLDLKHRASAYMQKLVELENDNDIFSQLKNKKNN